MLVSDKERHQGFFEFIPEDGSTVDLTQPGLLSRDQLVSIIKQRGFDILVSDLFNWDLVGLYESVYLVQKLNICHLCSGLAHVLLITAKFIDKNIVVSKQNKQ